MAMCVLKIKGRQGEIGFYNKNTCLFSGFLTTRFRIMRQEFLCNCCAAGKFCIAWIASSPAPASIARAAFSGDLKESTEIRDIICTMMKRVEKNS